jgi:hypothetical protein
MEIKTGPIEQLVANVEPTERTEISRVSDGDLGLAPLPVRPALLSPQEIRRLGALQVELVADQQMRKFLEQQESAYQQYSKAELIEELLLRDQRLASEGRAAAQGVTGGRLLREFVRGVLTAVDNKDPQRVEKLLQALGAEPADARQLRLHGTTLGDGKTQEERDHDFHYGKDPT